MLQLVAFNIRKIRNYINDEVETQRLAAGGARSPKYDRDKNAPAFGPHGTVDPTTDEDDRLEWAVLAGIDSS